MKNSRRIGKVAELEAADRLNRVLGTNFRRSSQNRGAPDAPDLIDDDWPEVVVEVKRRESMNLHNVVNQAREECAAESVPIVVHRRKRERWLVTVDLLDLPEVVSHFARTLGRLDPESDPEADLNCSLEDFQNSVCGYLTGIRSNARSAKAGIEAEAVDGKRGKK